MRNQEEVSTLAVSRGEFAGTLQISLSAQGQLLTRFTNIQLNGTSIRGEAFFIQQGGPTHGFRNLFGLAPIPVSGQYALGGFVNLDILHPTAGREALSRESIQHIANLVELIEAESTTVIAETDAADENQQFQQRVLNQDLIVLAKNVKVTVLPARSMIRLRDVKSYEPSKVKHFYAGQDPTILKRFASDNASLLHVSQSNPRRNLQHRFLTEITKLEQVPEETIVERVPATQLTLEEAMFLVRLRSVLLDDYLVSDVDAAFAAISHGVSFHVEKKSNILYVSIARGISPVAIVLECYSTARDVFEGFMKDFVREHLYPHIRDHVPSSTKQGREALYKRLKENKELFRLQERDYGAIESLLADYLAGKADFSEVLRTSSARSSVQRQEVSKEQVGSVENELPGIIGGSGPAAPPNELEPAPPILRDDLDTDMKVLTVSAQHQKFNNFQMFLALSDRLIKSEGEFLRWPHATKLIWAAHRVVYIFTDASGGLLSLYYDIELRTPLGSAQTGGAMIPTTTIVTKSRMYVPVPKELEPAFRITDGAKEFYVRFDTIP